MQCVILAGGLGTRMLPLTESVPKALLPVAGRPFAWHQLHWLARSGVSDVLYCIGHKGEQIREFWNGTPAPIPSIRYVDEGDELLGTGGALRLALEQGALQQSFLVLYGDSFLPIPFTPVWDAFQRSQSPALMTVLRNCSRWDRSNVRFSDGRVELYDKTADPAQEKMEFIDYGLSVMRRDVVRALEKPSDLASLYHALSVRGELAGMEVHDRFYEIGSPEGLHDLEGFLAGQSASPQQGLRRPERDPAAGPSASLAPNAPTSETGDIRLRVPHGDVADPEISIVIPALNEEITITEFVRWCMLGLDQAGVQGEVLIVDSSSDATPDLALAAGARVLQVPKRGLGRAYLDAIPFVRGKFIIMGDADLTYDFRELAPFVARWREGNEFVMGSRFKGTIEEGAMPALHRYFGTPLTNWILNVLYSADFSDIHCGMRGITRDALLRMNLKSQSWEYASEMVLKSVQMELKRAEVPVHFFRDREGRVSHHLRMGWLSPWLAGWINLKSMLIHGAEFFTLRPGLFLLAIGLGLTLPLAGGPIVVQGRRMSMYWMLFGMTLSLAGLQSFFLGCLSQLLHDYSGRARARWLRLFRYNQAMLASAGSVFGGIACLIPLVTDYLREGFTLSGTPGTHEHVAILGLLLVLGGISIFAFTLVLHAAATSVQPPGSR
jgi:dTDP-glucose pyrophosphorylase/glycosyltransferase involved in cell wall biosynthesis